MYNFMACLRFGAWGALLVAPLGRDCLWIKQVPTPVFFLAPGWICLGNKAIDDERVWLGIECFVL